MFRVQSTPRATSSKSPTSCTSTTGTTGTTEPAAAAVSACSAATTGPPAIHTATAGATPANAFATCPVQLEYPHPDLPGAAARCLRDNGRFVSPKLLRCVPLESN